MVRLSSDSEINWRYINQIVLVVSIMCVMYLVEGRLYPIKPALKQSGLSSSTLKTVVVVVVAGWSADN